MCSVQAHAEQRGFEHVAHHGYEQPPLDKIRPISPTNKNRTTYLNAAEAYLQSRGLPG